MAHHRKPVLEWIAAAVGVTLTLALLGFIGWNAIQTRGDSAPAISVTVASIEPRAGAYLVRFVARNDAPTTAAAVQISGQLRRPGVPPETSSVTLDYLPGDSRQEGGLIFTHDPRTGQLTLRPLGYVEP
jgi:uncharacterized protein (TIGR02588 family)